MRLEIITPDTNLYSGDATSIVAPGIDGSLGILENHAPIITTLAKGTVKVTEANGKDLTFDVNGGVLETLACTTSALNELGTSSLSVSISKGDILVPQMRRTTNTGSSTYAFFVGEFQLVGDRSF